MSGYSKTNADLSREVLTDNGDGTGLLQVFNPAGELLSSESVNLPVPVVAQPNDLLVGFAQSIIGAESLQEMRDAAQALLDSLGGA